MAFTLWGIILRGVFCYTAVLIPSNSAFIYPDFYTRRLKILASQTGVTKCKCLNVSFLHLPEYSDINQETIPFDSTCPYVFG